MLSLDLTGAPTLPVCCSFLLLSTWQVSPGQGEGARSAPRCPSTQHTEQVLNIFEGRGDLEASMASEEI